MTHAPATNPSAPPRTLMPADVLRVFFSVWPDAAARNALAKLANAVAAETGGRAPAIQNLHLTLAFVGDVAIDRIEALRVAGLAATEGVPAFNLSLDRVGAFRGAGIAWAGAAVTPPALLALARRLNDALAAAGFPTDPRPFQLHVTLARRCRRPPAATMCAPIAWAATGITLNASELAPGGSRYREIAGWPLGRGNDRDQETRVPLE